MAKKFVVGGARRSHRVLHATHHKKQAAKRKWKGEKARRAARMLALGLCILAEIGCEVVGSRGMSGKPESEAFIGEGENRRVVKKTGCAAFCAFLYDKEHGTFLGRTPLSWFEITVFYIIFYAGLVGFWAACLAIFLQTIDYKVPTWYGKGTIIGVNPGMGYQPWIAEKPDSTLIRFNMSEPESYTKYVAQIDKYLAKYDDLAGTRTCGSAQSNVEDGERPCRFEPKKAFGSACNAGNAYGYKDGKPCVIITLNRLIGWMPTEYPKDSVPAQVKDYYKKGDVPIHCEGEYFADQENMGPLSYHPKEGIQAKYFPYRMSESYHQPIAMVKFNNPRKGIVMEVECKAFAYNIVHDRTDRQGMVHFELLVDASPSS